MLNTIAEARYISPDVKGMADSHRFFYDLKSNEEAEIVIGYILDETYTYDSPLYYCLSSDNNYSDDLFLYLGELTERMAEPSTPEDKIVNEMKEAKAQETEMSFEELVVWEQGAEFANLAAFATTDAHMADLNTPVLTDNILYQITEVEIGKEIGDHDQSLIDYGNIAKDENGNITDKATFIWITMKLKNYGSEEQSFWLNKHLFGVDENNTVYETLSSVKYMDPIEEDAKPYQELFLTLEGGEEREVTLGYIIADESEANCRSDLPLYYRTELRGDKPSFYMYVGELTNGNE